MRRRATIVLSALALAMGCAGPDTEPPCECVGAVSGGNLEIACGERQCIAGTRYLCTSRNAAVGEGTCAAPNPRPAEAPDLVVFSVSGHCLGLDCPAYNPEYLVSERDTPMVVTDVFELRGRSTWVLGYGDSFYNLENDGGDIVLAGFLQLLADLVFVRNEWIGDFDNPTRVVVIAHSHGVVWSHLALDVLERTDQGVPVDILIDLDGNSLSWEDDLATLFAGDNWGDVIRTYNAETGTTWPFSIDTCADYWLIDGLKEAQDEEDVVPDLVALNLEVFSGGTPNDPDPNHRRDGTMRGILSFGPTSNHNGVTYVGSEAMDWVADEVEAAYRW